MKHIYFLYHDTKTAVVTSDRAAREWARKELGVSRVYKITTHDGWQLWAKDDDDPITVVIA